jgi:hypothetical protein
MQTAATAQARTVFGREEFAALAAKARAAQ